MKTHLEFTSSAFPAYPGEDKQINPGIFGKRLAEFLAENLFGANENGPTFANQKDPTRMAVGLTPAADDFI